MGTLQRYRKKAGSYVVAAQLNLDTDGFTYRKWGAEQRCKPGDWLVDNDGEAYTIDGAVFERTYRKVSPGVYEKITRIWAEVALEAGSIDTVEGVSHYKAGDYLVYNNEDRTDAYCIDKEKFDSMYEPDE
jgi:hypothetical protein